MKTQYLLRKTADYDLTWE